MCESFTNRVRRVACLAAGPPHLRRRRFTNRADSILICAYTRAVPKAYPTAFMAASAHGIRDAQAGRNHVASVAEDRPVGRA